MLWKLLTSVALIYVALASLMYCAQSRLVFLPHVPGREVTATPSDIGLDYERVRIATEDGPVLDGWFVPALEASLTLLFFHGNAGNISHRLDSIEIFHRLGLNVLIVDYRGYGRSQGRPSEQGTYADALAAWRYLVGERAVPPREVVILGRSLGGAVAAWLAARTGPRALILESTFTSAPDLGAKLYPWLPVRALAHIQYPTKRYVRSVACPVLVIHSRDDETVPFDHGQALLEAAPEPKRLLTLRGGHNDGFLLSEPRYVQTLEAFIRQAGADRSPSP